MIRPSRSLQLACLAVLLSCSLERSAATRFSADVSEVVSDALWLECNKGRRVVRDDGFFAFPNRVKRVWIDVGAHHLETTGHLLLTQPDLGLIAIEPISEAWQTWPRIDRLIGIPAAISLERGFQDFNINANPTTSSLLKSTVGHVFEERTKTVEVRSVPVLRLEDVLERIPAHLDVDLLKTDVQGLDLQVLKSAGDQLRRVRRVRTEIINAAFYEKAGSESMSSEREFHTYMRSMGFSLVGESAAIERAWIDAYYRNDRKEP